MRCEALILLPAFNGSRYIREQIASIQEQSMADWRLWVSDDASADETPAMVSAKAHEDERISLRSNARRLGLRAHINQLFQEALRADADYIFLADQDDVWRPNKLEVQLEAMRAEESTTGAFTPILVHSELCVIDWSSAVQAESFWRRLRIAPGNSRSIEALPAHNIASGNAILVNRALLRLAVPVPDSAVMHDWWLALIAAATGRILYLDQPLMSYRQHSTNVVGPKSFVDALAAFRAGSSGWRREFRRTLAQAQAAAIRLQGNPLHSGWLEKLQRYAKLETMGRVERFHALEKVGVSPLDRARRLVFWAKVLLL